MNINRKKIPACFLSFMALSLFSDVASAQVGSVDMAGVGDMLRRLGEEIQASQGYIHTILIIIGIVIVVWSIGGFAGQFQRLGGLTSTGSLVSGMLVGSLLINNFFFLQALSWSLFRDSAYQKTSEILSYTAPSNQFWPGYIFFSVVVIMLVGWLGIVRGALLLKGGNSQQGRSIGHAATLLIGGTLAANFPAFITVLATSIGGGFGDAINQIINGIGI